MIKINNDWDVVLKDEFNKEYFIYLMNKIDSLYKSKTIFPEYGNIFNALKLTSFENTKVIIIGQDPYHEFGQANGLAFSVNEGVKLPPSLVNIYKEMKTDLEIDNKNGDLTPLAKEGVLLLNDILTVEEGKANSHKNFGWNIFTNGIIKMLSDRKEHLVFILWGNNAIKKEELIDNNKHLIIKSVHPSPLSASRGFFGSKPFSKTNNYLIKNKIKPINWKI